MTGELEYDGEDDSFYRKASGIRFGWLRQQDELGDAIDLWASMRSVFQEIDDLEKRIRVLEKEMADPEVYGDEARFEEICNRYARATGEFEHLGGYTITSEIRAILFGLGFQEADFQLRLEDLSGGNE
jgi:ATP-binding cassette subfamily F protein 3